MITNNYGMNSSLTSTNDFSERTQDCPVIKTIMTVLTNRPPASMKILVSN